MGEPGYLYSSPLLVETRQGMHEYLSIGHGKVNLAAVKTQIY